MKLLWWRKEPKTNRRNPAPVVAKPPLKVSFNLRVIGSLMMMLTIAALAAVAVDKVVDPKTMPLQMVQIEGAFNKVSAEEVRLLVRDAIAGNFFTVDMATITSAVSELPWVASAEVRRVWPDRLHVVIEEQQAIARMAGEGLVNVRGELFYPDIASYPEGLVKLSGPATTVRQMAVQYREFALELHESGIEMAQVELTDRRAWQLVLRDGTEVLLGREHLTQRMQRFVSYYPSLAAVENGVQRVDMRYTNGFAVRWRTAPHA